jgi:hypothetical protein
MPCSKFAGLLGVWPAEGWEDVDVRGSSVDSPGGRCVERVLMDADICVGADSSRCEFSGNAARHGGPVTRDTDTYILGQAGSV